MQERVEQGRERIGRQCFHIEKETKEILQLKIL